MQYSIRSLLLLLLLGLAASGCSASAPEAMASPCTSNDDCGSGEVCGLDSQQCLPSSGLSPALEVLPPSQNNQGWVAQEFPRIVPGSDGRLVAQLEAGVAVSGMVSASDTQEPIPARIVAWRDSLLSGRPRVQAEATVGDPRREGPLDTYLLWLNRGHAYTFLIEPLAPHDAEYPPLLVETGRLADHLKRDFVLYGKNQSVAVKGTVRSFDGESLGFSVRVRAYQEGGLIHSTIAESDPLTGAFSFRIPPGVAPYTVRVESLPGGRPIPTIDCPGIALGIVPALKEGQAIGELQLPPIRYAEPFTVRVRGTAAAATMSGAGNGASPADEDAPVVGATVTFATTVPMLAVEGFDKCTASFSQSAITDPEGKATLALLPGTTGKNQRYSVTVVSPPRSPFASRWIPELEVGSKAGVLADLVLDARYWIKGQIVMKGEKPVPGASIEAQGIGTSSAPLPVTMASGITDKQGTFELYLDPGIFNIDIRPPKELGVPSFGLTAVKVDGNIDHKIFEIPEARALSGRVVDPKGKGLSGAQVQIYELAPSSERPVTHKAVLRASSVTDSGGSFSLLLPENGS